MASGQCYSCGTGFGLFKKEHGCKQCGFAFCARCLTKSVEIPKLNNTKHKVCNKCYNILSGKQSADNEGAKYSPPEAYKKRLAALAEKEAGGHKNSHGGGGSGGHHKAHSKPLKPEDDIARRLEKLKDKPKAAAPVTDDAINKRLADLKGVPAQPQSNPAKPFYQPPNRLTQQEQVDELLDEIADEVEIDSHMPTPSAEVESRLAQLKGKVAAGASAVAGDNDLNKQSNEPQKIFDKNIEGKGAAAQSCFNKDEGEVNMEEMHRLMQQAARDLEVDAQRAIQGLQEDQAIMARLNELKKKKNAKENAEEDGNQHPDKTSNLVPLAGDHDSDDENEDVAAQKIVKQFLEEAKLEEHEPGEDEGAQAKPKSHKESRKSSKSSENSKKVNTDRKDSAKKSDDDNFDEDDDELPYCCICTENATLRCHGCDLDLYCARCWKESHTQCEMMDHETSKYTMPKSWRGP